MGYLHAQSQPQALCEMLCQEVLQPHFLPAVGIVGLWSAERDGNQFSGILNVGEVEGL